MKRSLIHRPTAFNFLKLFLSFFVLTNRMKGEEHLLAQSPIELFRQFQKGLTVVMIQGWQIVGHVTLWELKDGWYELGTFWVDPAVRKHGAGEEIMKSILEARPDLNILFTTTNSVVKRMGVRLNCDEVSFWDLQASVHEATCVCDQSKTGTGCYKTCHKKDGSCSLFVRVS